MHTLSMAKGKIHSSADSTIDLLRGLKTFYALTEHSYELNDKMVQDGLAPDRPNLPQGCEHYYRRRDLRRDLPRLVFFQAVAYFEVFVTDVLFQLNLTDPSRLPRVRMDPQELLKASSPKDLLPVIIDNVVSDIPSHEWLERICKLRGVPAFKKSITDTLNEIKATRDCHAHNGGRANARYLKRLRNSVRKPRAQEGKMLPLDRKYAYKAGDFLVKLVKRIWKRVSKG